MFQAQCSGLYITFLLKVTESQEDLASGNQDYLTSADGKESFLEVNEFAHSDNGLWKRVLTPGLSTIQSSP